MPNTKYDKTDPQKKENPGTVRKRKKSKKKRILRGLLIAGIVIAALFLVIWGAYHIILDHYLGMINIVTTETGEVYETERITDEYEPITEEVYTEEIEPVLPLICDNEDVTNILLLATDSRNGEAARSDTMILLSVNSKTKKVVLCSFMRDILAKYPMTPSSPVAGGYDKLNHAHAYGGPALTMAVLKETFNIDVQYYAKVDFYVFLDIVDAMGGVELYITKAEAQMINDFLCVEEDRILFGITDEDMIPQDQIKDGVITLTGLQALCHARNRNLGSDWARTERQRNVIKALANKASKLSISQLDLVLNKTLPKVTTNIQKDMLKDLVGNLPAYLGYDIISTRIPENGMYTEQNYAIIPDLEANCNMLYEKIYGKKPETAN